MFQKIINIGTNSLRRKNMSVMLNKVITQLSEKGKALSDTKLTTRWAAERAGSLEDFVCALDEQLWKQTQKTCEKIALEANKKLEEIDFLLGGGGHYPLLYFLVRHFDFRTVVETGVAAGWSSNATLKALQENGGNGKLYSSDFPYFRHKNPESVIGYVVDEDLKKNWHLFIDGDQRNLKKILNLVDQPIDLFHYDSDKSYSGREFALKLIFPNLSNKAIIIFDDIQDNFHFRDFVTEGSHPYKVFEFEEKYIGMTGPYFDDE